MKRLRIIIALLLIVAMSHAAGKAKYVFYFIGDGMGVNQVNITEMYLSALKGNIGVENLLMTQFPAFTMATTYSNSSPVTDSAASGTALASGTKTYNGAIGVDKDSAAVYSIAVDAKKAGKKVGILTSVSINHATPASFYAHQNYRKMYYEIASDIPASGFDFFAGSGFVSPTLSYDKHEMPDVEQKIKDAGYLVLRGMEQYRKHCGDKAPKVLIQTPDKDQQSLPYAIDRKANDITLADLTRCAIEQLDGKQGFFMMVEGGKIDWAAHDNDPHTMIREVIDMDSAVRVAYDFYLKHPHETLIVISADHETGGLTMARDKIYDLYLTQLLNQHCSLRELSNAIHMTRVSKGEKISYADIQKVLSDKMGFWNKITLTWEQEKKLRDAYEKSFVTDYKRYAKLDEDQIEPVARVANRVMSQVANIGWTTGGHTAGYVPVYAIGAGQELFHGRLDNALLPMLIKQAAGY